MAIAAHQKIPPFIGAERTSVCSNIQRQSIPSVEKFKEFMNYIAVGDREAVQGLLPKFRFYLNFSLTPEITPFTKAATLGHYEIAEILLDYGARIPKFNCPVLFFAVKEAKISFIRKLAVQENSIERTDDRGRTIWHYIALSPNPCGAYFSMVEVLPENVIKKIKETIDDCALGQAPLEVAIYRKNINAIFLLITQGANFYPFLMEKYSPIWKGIEEIKNGLLARRFF